MLNRLEEFEAWLRETLRSACPKDYENERVGSWGLNELLQTYVAWCNRHIPVRRRKTTWAKTFTMPPDDAENIRMLSHVSESGGDLNGYLSMRRKAPNFKQHSRPNKQGKWKIDWSSETKDRVLNTYGLHHLHLRQSGPSGKRSGESDKLLFVKTYRNELHFVYFGTHRSFKTTAIHEAATTLALREGQVLNGVKIESRDIVAQDHLAWHGSNSLSKVGGKVVWPTELTSSGASLYQSRHADKVFLTVKESLNDAVFREKLAILSDRDGLIDHLEGLKWRMDWNDLVLLDEMTERAYIAIGWRT